MNRREFLKFSGIFVAGNYAQALQANHSFSDKTTAKDKNPNILMITCHDIGQHIGCYGVKTVHTENIDGLAKNGIRFQNFYSTSAVCSPGRGSLFTGRYPQSNGLMGLTHKPWNWKLNKDEKHLASILKDNGYETYLIGFNHIAPETPHRLGYQEISSKDHKAEETVSKTTDLLKKRKKDNKPFFAKVGFFEVHRPFSYGKDTSKGTFIPGWLQNTNAIRSDLEDFQGEIKYFDNCIGRIIESLQSSAVAKNTLVIFTSDHGIPYPGAKWTVRKAGIETPLIIYQPDSMFSGGKVFHNLMSNVDVMPTLLDYLNIEKPDNLQGYSFFNLINGNTNKTSRKAVFAQYTVDMKRDNPSRSILTQRYHLIRYFDQGRTVIYPTDADPLKFAQHIERAKFEWGQRPFAQLFDIQEDPYELKNLAGKKEYKKIVNELSSKLYKWMKDVDDPLLKGPVRTPYYNKAIKDLRKHQ